MQIDGNVHLWRSQLFLALKEIVWSSLNRKATKVVVTIKHVTMLSLEFTHWIYWKGESRYVMINIIKSESNKLHGLRIRRDFQSLNVVLLPSTSDHLMREPIWPNAIEAPHARDSLLDLFLFSAGGFSENGSNCLESIPTRLNLIPRFYGPFLLWVQLASKPLRQKNCTKVHSALAARFFYPIDLIWFSPLASYWLVSLWSLTAQKPFSIYLT